MARVPDWPARLAAVLAAAENRPFDAHRWNCAGFAMAAIEACTGARPAVRVLPDLEASADTAGFRRVPPVLAGAGDVVLGGGGREGDPPRLGVVVACGRAAFVGARGLVREPVTDCRAAWRIA